MKEFIQLFELTESTRAVKRVPLTEIKSEAGSKLPGHAADREHKLGLEAAVLAVLCKTLHIFLHLVVLIVVLKWHTLENDQVFHK